MMTAPDEMRQALIEDLELAGITTRLVKMNDHTYVSIAYPGGDEDAIQARTRELTWTVKVSGGPDCGRNNFGSQLMRPEEITISFSEGTEEPWRLRDVRLHGHLVKKDGTISEEVPCHRNISSQWREALDPGFDWAEVLVRAYWPVT